MTENWKAIVGYEGKYEVSDLGNVRSLARSSSDGRRVPAKMLKPGVASNGYKTVALCRDGKGKTHTIHSLVAAAFVGGRPGGLVVDHINGDRLDNLPSNLRYVEPIINNHNRHALVKSKSGVLGVYRNAGKWAVQIGTGGKSKYIGRYSALEAAAAARLAYEESAQWRGL